MVILRSRGTAPSLQEFSRLKLATLIINEAGLPRERLSGYKNELKGKKESRRGRGGNKEKLSIGNEQ